MLTQKFSEEKVNIQKQIDKFAKKHKGKKIILYGAGLFANELINKCNLFALNIVGIVDKKFENNKPETYLNFKTYTPDELKEIDYDVIFLSVLNTKNVLKYLKNAKNKNAQIYYLKINFWNKISKLSIISKNSNESCMICNSKGMNASFAPIAPFLIDAMFEFKEEKTELLYCPRCKVSYFKLRPNQEQMSKYYSGYDQEEHRRCREKYEPGLYKSISKRLKALDVKPDMRYKEFENNISCLNKDIKLFDNVLDYGGYGKFFNADFDHTTKYAYDTSINFNTINLISKTVNIVNNLNELQKNSFDFITAMHVLEHLSNPRHCIEEMATLLKKNGYLYIELPDETGLNNDIHSNIFRNFVNDNMFQMHEHINIFKLQTIKYLLKSSGFEVISCQSKRCNIYGYRGYFWCLAKKK